jgi:hypothetical protein
MAFSEDLTVFFDSDDFAVAATYRRGDGSAARTVNVIFDRAWIDALGVDSTSPRALGAASDFTDWKPTAEITIGDEAFLVREPPQPQDDGALVLLKLELKE